MADWPNQLAFAGNWRLKTAWAVTSLDHHLFEGEIRSKNCPI